MSIGTKSSARRLLLALAVLIAAVAAYWPTVVSLWEPWTQTRTYGHGLLVVGLALWLALGAVRQPRGESSRESRILLTGLLGLAALIWMLGFVAGVVAIQQLALPFILFSLLASVTGARMCRDLAVPCVAFMMVLPAWDHAIPMLQAIAVLVVENAARLFGIPVIVEGTRLHIPAGVFEIAEGCSGLRVLLAVSVLAVFAAELGRLPRERRFVLVGIAVVLALFSNWLRILTLVLLGHFTEMQHPLVWNHLLFGDIIYLVFAVVPVLLISRHEVSRTRQGLDTEPRRAALASALPRSLLFLGLFLGFGVPASARILHSYRYAGMEAIIQLPEPRGEWREERSPLPWHPEFPGAANDAVGVYSNFAGDRVYLYAVSYLAQKQGAELIGYTSRLMGSWTWHELGTAPSGMRKPARVARLTAYDDSREAWRVWLWFQSGDRFASTDTGAKLHQLLAWFGDRKAASLFAVATPCPVGCDAAERRLHGYLRSHPGVVDSVAVVRPGGAR